MLGYAEHPLGDNYVLEVIQSHSSAVIAKIYHLTSRDPKIYREIGLVVIYWEKADPEVFLDHWQGECYLSKEHLSDVLIDELGNQLLKNTECREPFLLNVWSSERTTGTYREYGQVRQPEDDNP